MATVVLPRAGLRGGVLHLPFLLSGAGLLRCAMPAERAAATTAGRNRPGAQFRPRGLAGAGPRLRGEHVHVAHAMIYLATTSTLWWFGSRHVEKAMK